MEKTHISKKPKFFYGYWIVLTGFFCLFIQSGFAYYAFSLFVKPLQNTFPWGRGEIMVGLTIYMWLGGLSSPIAGRLLDRYGVQKIVTAGAFITGIGFIVLWKTVALWQFYIGWTLTGLGTTCLGQVPIMATVSNWFKKRRGTFLGLTATGIGAAGVVLAPIIANFLIPNYGWRTTYLILGIFVIILIAPLGIWVLKYKPAEMGLLPYGAETAEEIAKVKTDESSGMTLKMAMGTSAFGLISIALVLSQFSHVGVLQNQVPHLQDIGYPVALAAGALGTTALGSLIGKFFFGWLCDQIKVEYAFLIGVIFQAIGCGIMLLVGPTTPVVLIWLYAIALGLGIGSWLPILSMITSKYYGLVNYGTIFGMISLIQRIGSGSGPLVIGYMYDAAGNYHNAFILCFALFAIAIPAVIILRKPKSAA